MHEFFHAHPWITALSLVAMAVLWLARPWRHRLRFLAIRRVRHQRQTFDPPAWVISWMLGKWFRHRPRWLNRRHPWENALDLALRVVYTTGFVAIAWMTFA